LEGSAEVGKPVLKTGPGLTARGIVTSAFLWKMVALVRQIGC
jgi:hypothetical protein